MQRLGIGIVTYNRQPVLAATVEKLRRFTRYPNVGFVVADDGSTDGTSKWMRDNHIPTVTGINMGIAWNKNRALYLLSALLCCDTVILLEDDTQPTKSGWEEAWIEAGCLWGHANYAAPWMRHLFLSGKGTPADPVLCGDVTAQCAVFSREALLYGGYFDPRFRGYGHEHVEHTRRLSRVGYSNADEMIDGRSQARYRLIASDLAVVDVPSFADLAQADRNQVLAGQLMAEDSFRAPWHNDTEMRQFRAEMRSALAGHPSGFSLHAPAVRRRSWARLFGRGG